MDDEHPDRMATPRTRGRPPKFGIGTPTPPPQDEPKPVERVEVPRTVLGIRCPHCGRGMMPRRDRVAGDRCYATCVLCGARLELRTDDAGVMLARVL